MFKSLKIRYLYGLFNMYTALCDRYIRVMKEYNRKVTVLSMKAEDTIAKRYAIMSRIEELTKES